MADLFKEILPSILQNKKNVLTDAEEVKSYNPYIVNKALAGHLDCVMYSNQMNMNFHLDKDAQYQYHLNSIRSAKRPFAQWFKATKESDLEAVKLFFGYSDRRAREALKILTDEQIETIRIRTTIGE